MKPAMRASQPAIRHRHIDFAIATSPPGRRCQRQDQPLAWVMIIVSTFVLSVPGVLMCHATTARGHIHQRGVV